MVAIEYDEIIKKWGEPLFRFRPEINNGSDYENQHLEEVPDEIIVVSIKKRKPCGVMTFANYGANWYANEGERFTIRHLLQLTGYFKSEKSAINYMVKDGMAERLKMNRKMDVKVRKI